MLLVCSPEIVLVQASIKAKRSEAVLYNRCRLPKRHHGRSDPEPNHGPNLPLQ